MQHITPYFKETHCTCKVSKMPHPKCLFPSQTLQSAYTYSGLIQKHKTAVHTIRNNNHLLKTVSIGGCIILKWILKL